MQENASQPDPWGDPVDHGDRNTMNAWPKVAWNMLDEDDTQNEYRCLVTLSTAKEVPTSPFIPLGDFDLRRHIEMDAEIAKGYLIALQNMIYGFRNLYRMPLNEFAVNGGETTGEENRQADQTARR